MNGFGKTFLVAELIRYFLDMVPDCAVGFTSHVSRQCEMLEGYLRRHQATHFRNWKLIEGRLEHPNGNFARWFTAKDEGGVESLHAKFMIRIIDEVKSMGDNIVDATNRWNPSLSIFVSSKGLVSGKFHSCWTDQRQFWDIVEATAFDCPWISQAWIAEQIIANGRDSPLIKSMIFNEFNDASMRSIIPIDAWMRVLKTPPFFQGTGKIVCGLDLSAAKKGGDECVLFHRDGNKVFPPFIVPISSNEMEVVGRVLQHLREIKANVVNADAGGLGGPMIARLCEVCEGDKTIQFNRINFNGAVLDQSAGYYNRIAELWGVAQQYVEKFQVIVPNDPKLQAQMTSREVFTNSEGKIRLESKDIMKKRIGCSPDRADAFVLCLIADKDMPMIKTLGKRTDGFHRGNDDDEDDGRGRNWRVNASGFDLGGF